jgi:redox-regulated HSP33 family molecular chaperone
MTLTTRIAWDDTVLPFQLDRSDIRGRVARLDTTLEQILSSTTTRRRWRRWWPRWRC